MRKRKWITLICAILGVFLLTLIIGKVRYTQKFEAEVKRLFAQPKISSQKSFFASQIIGLPEPVKKYFNAVLKEGQPYINCVRMTHGGQFKTGIDKSWINIAGEQYATTENPGFIWKGSTNLFVAEDSYINGSGRLKVSLLSLVKIVDGTGEKYNQGELLRWLGESVLYPTNLLPSERLKWLPIDSLTAKLIFNHKGLSLFFVVKFNAKGHITEMQTKRFMDENSLETWVIKVSDYKELNQVLVPTHFEVLWRLKEGDFSYARFTMKKLEYDIQERF